MVILPHRRKAFRTNDVTTGLVADWDADTVAGSDGSAVSLWVDTVGGYNGTQASAPLRPLLRTNAIYGRNALEFSSKALVTTLTTAFGDFTVVAVAKVDTGSGYDRIVDKNYASGFWVGRSGTQLGSGCLQAGAPYMTVASGATAGSWYVMSGRRSGTSYTVRFAGSTYAGSATVSSAATDGTPVRFGVAHDGSGSFFGRLHRVRIYSRALSDAERLVVETLLGTRTGLPVAP